MRRAGVDDNHRLYLSEFFSWDRYGVSLTKAKTNNESKSTTKQSRSLLKCFWVTHRNEEVENQPGIWKDWNQESAQNFSCRYNFGKKKHETL